MIKNKIFLLNPRGEAKALDVEYEEHDIDWIYNLLDISTFDIVDRYIGKTKYSFYVDDEGLLKPNLPVAFCSDYDEMLVGKIFICKYDEDEDKIVDLTEDDIKNIESHIQNTKGSIVFIGGKITATNMILHYSLNKI